jgi:hypothetical protein
MSEYTTFSPRCSLVAVGILMRRMGIWAVVERCVHIKQKTVTHTPVAKLLHAFINILAGGQGLCEVNTRVRPDRALQRAFGRARCADQSQVSRTLNQCGEENVAEMRQGNKEVYRTQGVGYHHNYDQQWQLLDVDTSGLPADKQGEQVTKRYFSGKRGSRGRQLGRVWATLYEEIIVDRLYSGKVQLEKSFPQLVEMAEDVLDLGPAKRKRTILRFDASAGTDQHINWALERGYQVLTKVKNWQRVVRLTQSIEQWYDDPKVADRQLAWVPEPHLYARPTRQLAVRRKDKKGDWKVRILVTTLDHAALCWLARQPFKKEPRPIEEMCALAYAYDLRGGGVETSIKDSKQGLGITKRNKRNFHAQEMLVLLAQLARNLIVWTRNEMARHVPSWAAFGSLRMVRDVFHISGKIRIDGQGRILRIKLNRDHVYAARFLAGIAPALSSNDLMLTLRKTWVRGLLPKQIAGFTQIPVTGRQLARRKNLGGLDLTAALMPSQIPVDCIPEGGYNVFQEG